MENSDNLELLKGFAKGKEKIAKKGGRAVIYSRVSSKEQVEGVSLFRVVFSYGPVWTRGPGDRPPVRPP